MTALPRPRRAKAGDFPPAILVCAAGIAAAVAAAYWGGLHGAFVFDDVDSIPANASIRDFSTALAPPAGATVSGRPFLNLSFALNYALSGLNPLGYHASNLGIHVLAALALFGIVRRTLATPAAGSQGRRASVATAFAAALLWALHPLQVESVEYIVQRAESLMGLLYLLTLYAFIRHAEGGKSAAAWASAAFASCLLGMATKEAMVTAPLMVLLYDRTFIAGSFRAAWERHGKVLVSLAACWVPLVLQVANTGGRSGTAGFGSGVPWWAYGLQQLKAIVLYLRLAAWPRPLVGDYGRVLAAGPLEVAACGAGVAVLVAATVFLLVRRPALGFLGAWFLVILAPSSSIVPVATEIIALHRMYLPLAAVAVAGVLGLRAALGGNRPFQAAVLLAALGLATATSRRIRVYEGPRAFWSDVTLKAPWNAGAWNNLGLVELESGSPALAVADFQRALAAAPAFATAHFNLGKSLLAIGRPGEAAAHLKEALRYLPRDASVHQQLGRAYAAVHDFGGAVSELHEAVALDPDRADAWFDLGVVMEQAGATGPAMEGYARAVRLNPNYPEARLDYGNLLAQAGRLPEAIIQYEDDVRLEPRAADVHNNLGGLLAEAGRLPEAKAEFAEALRLKPDYAEARENLAHVRRMMGEAVPP
jgi:tetratricopeptide (TPR) repeat protein